MDTYSGKPAVINKPIGELYARFSDMSALQQAISNRTNDDTAQIADIKFEDNALLIVNPQIGEIRFEIVERVEPSRIAYSAVKSPLPLGMSINLTPVDEASTQVSTEINIELPAMMKMFLGSKLQQVADKFGDMMANMGC